MSQTLTPQQIADMRLKGWHAAGRGEDADPEALAAWRACKAGTPHCAVARTIFEGWHLRVYGHLPVAARPVKAEAPTATLRRLILASVDGARRNGACPPASCLLTPATGVPA